MKVSTNESYALSIEETAHLIARLGHRISFLVEGHIGSGKSTLLKMLIAMARFKDTHIACYFDCTTKDMGDLLIPNLQTIDKNGVVAFAPNSELGLQHGKPVILMFDELGKAVPPIRRAANRVALEHKIGEWELPEGSIVFATTNLGAEKIGDMMEAHSRDRWTPTRMLNATNIEWLENFAIPNRLNPLVMGLAKDTPEMFHSFEKVANPDDNHFIFHPDDPQRNAEGFTTLRGLERCSHILDEAPHLSDQAVTAALIGTIGRAGAKRLASFVNMHGEIPTKEDIKKDPLTAVVPEKNMAAQAMIVYQALATVERNWVDQWFKYQERLHPSMSGLFMQSTVSKHKETNNPKYPKLIDVCTQNEYYKDWCFKHNYVFTKDKQ